MQNIMQKACRPSQIVRVELKAREILEFIKFDQPLSTKNMAILEHCLNSANESNTPHPIQLAIQSFTSITGINAETCAAPYLYEITQD